MGTTDSEKTDPLSPESTPSVADGREEALVRKSELNAPLCTCLSFARVCDSAEKRGFSYFRFLLSPHVT